MAHKHYDVTAPKNEWDKAFDGLHSVPYSNEDLMEQRKELFTVVKILSANKYKTHEGEPLIIRTTALNRYQRRAAVEEMTENYKDNGNTEISAGFMKRAAGSIIEKQQNLYCGADFDGWNEMKKLGEWDPNTPVPIKNMNERDDEAATFIDKVLSTNSSFDVAIVIFGDAHFVDDRIGRKTIKQNLENAGYNVSHIFADNSKETNKIIQEQKALTVKNGGLFVEFAEPHTVQEKIESFLGDAISQNRSGLNISNMHVEDNQLQQISNHSDKSMTQKLPQSTQNSSLLCCPWRM